MRDLRYAVRVLAKAPSFTAAAVLTLALCIGANSAIYTVVDHVLLRPPPYPDPDRLVELATHFDRNGNDAIGQTGGVWESLAERVTTVDLATTSGGFGSTGINMIVGDRAEYVHQQRVSAGYFRVLGVNPALGRSFTAEEDRVDGPAAAILSHRMWAQVFGRDERVVGRPITLKGQPHTIVGVMPEGFARGDPVDVWTPVRPCRTCEGGGQNYEIIGRLKTGVTWAQAEADVAAAAQPVLDQLYRRDANRVHERLVPLQRGQSEAVRQPILILWSAVGAVLLIGCVNIAGLLLARGAVRAPEIATRIALGGGRAAILRQLLAESVVLAALGGAAGIALGYAAARVFATLLRDAFGVASGATLLDGRALAITAVAALGTGVVFGLFPALHASRVDLRATLVESGSGSIAGAARSWPRRAFVVAQIAIGVTLLVGAGLLIRSFDGLMRLRAGFDPTHVMTATLSLDDARYAAADRVDRLFEHTLDAMSRIAGVESAAASLTLPFERALNVGGRWASAPAGADQIALMNMTYVTPTYFETLRIPLLRGRVFTPDDRAGAAPVIIVNQAFVSRSSPDADPIGRQIVSGGVARTIVGVVGDIQQKASFGSFGPVAPVPATYVPVAQTTDAFVRMVHAWFSPSWFVRTRAVPQGVAAEMQRAVASVDPLLPFATFRTIDEVRAEAVATARAQMLLLGSLAALALLLAAVGLYALVANSITERTRELGIRLALGASPRQAITAAALPGLSLACAGVAIGVAAARAAATLLRHLVWGVSVADPLTFAVAAAVVLIVAAVAVIVPALRVLRLTPVRALRHA